MRKKFPNTTHTWVEETLIINDDIMYTHKCIVCGLEKAKNIHYWRWSYPGEEEWCGPLETKYINDAGNNGMIMPTCSEAQMNEALE